MLTGLVSQSPGDHKGTQIADFESAVHTLLPWSRRGQRGFHGTACDNSAGCRSTGRASVITTSPWLALLITVIGTPLLGALL
jgi:hypothetical protein